MSFFKKDKAASSDSEKLEAKIAEVEKKKKRQTISEPSQPSNGIFGGIKNSMSQFIAKQVEKRIVKFLHNQKPAMKVKLGDKGLPSCYATFVNDLVDENWPILEEEVQYQLRIRTDKPFIEIKKPEVPCICWIFWKIRAIIRYSSLPFDKTLGQSLKSPWWLLQTLVSLCPVYGISSFYFLFWFFMIDKGDEYQLVSFILSMKRFQFLTDGLIRGATGFCLYFYCVSQKAGRDSTADERCERYGPSMLIYPRLDLLAFGINLLLVWMILIFLPFSEQKGLLKFRIAERQIDKDNIKALKKLKKDVDKRDAIIVKINEKVEKLQKKGKEAKFEDFVEEFNLKKYENRIAEETPPEKTCCSCSRGGAMKFLIIWDMISFGLAFTFFYTTFHIQNFDSLNQAKEQIYFAKWIYAILAFPFVIFSIPLVSSLLTRAKPTAYDSYGNTVPIQGEITYLSDLSDNMQDGLSLDAESQM